jgi:predicted nucleotidyltransferase
MRLDVDDRRLAELCRRFGIARLQVFGSVARGEESPSSDVDVLYELLPGRHLGWEIEDLRDELQQLLGRPVDLVSTRGLNPMLRPEIEADARLLYAA